MNVYGVLWLLADGCSIHCWAAGMENGLKDLGL